MLWSPVECFYGIPERENKGISAPVSLSWAPFFLFALSYSDLVLFSYLYFLIIPKKPICFLTRGRKGVDLNESGGAEELRGTERKETIIRIQCMKKI